MKSRTAPPHLHVVRREETSPHTRRAIPKRTLRLRRRRRLSMFLAFALGSFLWAVASSWLALEIRLDLREARAATAAVRTALAETESRVAELESERARLRKEAESLRAQLEELRIVRRNRERIVEASRSGSLEHLSLRLPSGLYPEDIDAVLEGTPLYGLGASFVQAEADHGVNAGGLLAMAVHESGWGTSEFAQVRNNLFGFEAFDHNSAARWFRSKEDCIDYVSSYIQSEYLNPSGTWHSGGDTLWHVGQRWATDSEWSRSVASAWETLISLGLYD